MAISDQCSKKVLDNSNVDMNYTSSSPVSIHKNQVTEMVNAHWHYLQDELSVGQSKEATYSWEQMMAIREFEYKSAAAHFYGHGYEDAQKLLHNKQQSKRGEKDMRMRLIRLEKSEEGVLGVLCLDDKVFCCTLEPPDLGNERNESCIPEGLYKVHPYSSPKFGKTFQVMDVPNRTNILFHSGNWAGDTQGCLLLGQYFGKLRGNRAVLNSGATFRAFRHMLSQHDYDNGEVTISILSAYPPEEA